MTAVERVDPAACLARTTEHLGLSGHPAFEDTFVDLLAFPEGRS